MRRTSAYFISLLFILWISLCQVHAQDTIIIPLKIKVGIDLAGPAIYLVQDDIFSAEGYISADINEKVTAVFGAGYLDYKYSQYNYEYLNKGFFFRPGVDINLLKPEKSLGKYWAGIGLRYGLSHFNSEVPSIQLHNYWGATSSSIPPKTNWGHFVEISPGVRAEVLGNISIGWTVSLRMLLYTGTGKDLRPIYFPGFGNGVKKFSTAMNYFIVWNFRYKRIKVIIKKEVPEETEDTVESDNVQQGSGIRQ